MNFDPGMIEQKLLSIPAILIALTVHEYAHGYVALLRGDLTAKRAGRLTFNPIGHLDLFGTLMLFFGPFGWAKPVPVNSANLKNPKKDLILVSFAGPLSNILLALVGGIVFRFVIFPLIPTLSFGNYLDLFFKLFFQINLGIAFFNLIPVPPLDGSNILMGFLPQDKIVPYLRMMRHVPMILLILIGIEWAFKIPTISLILYPLFVPFLSFFHYLIYLGA
jgi:Zn-dependent protease